MSLLTPENYQRGFLIDDELMGGVSADEAAPGRFIGFVLRHTTGEYLGHQSFPSLELALQAIGSVQRDWAYETSSGCGSGNCGNGEGVGACGGNCGAAFKAGACGTDACPKGT